MKASISPLSKHSSKVFYLLLLSISITLPFSLRLNSILIVLLVVYWFLYLYSNEKFSIRKSKLLFIIILLFGIHIYSVFLASDYLVAIKDIEQKLSLLAFPLIMTTIPIMEKKQIKGLITSFVLSCFVLSILTFRDGFEFLSAEHRVWAMQDLLLLHRPILGLYCATCILFIFWMVANDERIISRIIYSFLAFWFFLFLIIINAKMSFLALIASVYILILIYLIQIGKIWVAGFLKLIVLSITALVFTFSTSFRGFITTLIKARPFSYDQYSSMMVDSFNVRLGIWQCCKEVISSNYVWLFGSGLGNSKTLLYECYVRNSFTVQAQDMLDSHNQYLDTWITLGIVGLLTLFLFFTVSIIIGVRTKNFLLYSFIILYGICCISESLLNTQKGLIILTLFYSIFAFHLQQNNKRTELN